MSADDAEVTEEDRRAAWKANHGDEPSTTELERLSKRGPLAPTNAIAQIIANARRDAYRAGQIAGLKEGLTLAAMEDNWKHSGEAVRARIRELKGETR